MRITCVHQGYELYGSDRSFIESVEAIRAGFPDAQIDVVLPRHGPIEALLHGAASRIVIEPVWVLRRRDLLRLLTRDLLRLPRAILRAFKRMKYSDLVYLNTTVLADYMLAARFRPGRAIIHVHELPQGAVLAILRACIRWSKAEVIFNSQSSRSAFDLPASVISGVIYNGVAGPPRAEPMTYDGSRPLRLLMLGRISRIKGQEVLIEALARLDVAMRPEVRIVGSAFEDPQREAQLATMIQDAGLDKTVSLQPFVADPASLYRWADVVAVPSRLPESLGRVAIEAMAFGRPPVASAIGGLVEVVADGKTGWLVEPGSATALAAALEVLIENPASWASFPEAGRARYDALFSEAVASHAIQARLRTMLESRPGLVRVSTPSDASGRAA
ncbi:glycosyltransferase family 4 protein [Beijerinckia sp. L45]|uniref:glycosyltransferase family 4 protein n=1 Tax=Beijerinckia sp. L45 TaxID=1641855 RepID=UPI00131B1B92|nr:glycosyltransferase family 4 protein [Beijerinckia sp. L45]